VKHLLAAVLLLSSFALSQAGKQLTIENIFAEGSITGRAPETIKWSPDGKKVSFIQRDDSGEHGALWYVDVATGNKAVLVAEEKLQELQPPISSIKDDREKERVTRYSVAGYHWAPDSQHILFDAHGQLWLYALDTGKAQQLTRSKEPNSAPEFSPDGRYLSYIRAHNLWVRDMQAGTERQLTIDGSDNLLNGEVDWLYAEELDVRSNYFWSPDSKQILFLQTDEKPVPAYPIEDFIPTHADVSPEKYPQPGDPNPVVRLLAVSVGAGTAANPFHLDAHPDQYIPRFGFIKPGVIWYEVFNRLQTHMDLRFANLANGKSATAFSEDEPTAWIDVNDGLKFLKGSHQFLWLSWRDGFQHIYSYTYDATDPTAAPARLEAQLTRGDYEVTDIEAVDVAAGRVYFTANKGDARQRQLFVTSLKAGGQVEQVSKQAGTHAPNFPDSGNYYVDNYSAIITPPTLSVCSLSGSCKAFWQGRGVAEYQLIKPEFIDFTAADGRTVLHGELLLPPNANAGSKVPLILNPYGGPHAQTVRDLWVGPNGLFDQIMVHRGFAILKVDNRGMGGRGKAFTDVTRRKLGETELADQLAALDQALKKYPQLDANRLGWWGWSYGGYMTLYAMTHSDRFKAGVSVAPVTDWRLYDSTYTERYMGTPKENPEGYKASAPLNAAKSLSGHLLIVHGTSDDNVHMQNTVEMINALIDAGKPFDLQLYPRKTHGIAGTKARTHLFHRIERQFEENLLGTPMESGAPGQPASATAP
jgi:dipeptidyl-peptidase-4